MKTYPVQRQQSTMMSRGSPRNEMIEKRMSPDREYHSSPERNFQGSARSKPLNRREEFQRRVDMHNDKVLYDTMLPRNQ